MNKPPRNITCGSPGKGISLGSSADEPSLSSWSVFVMFAQRLRLAVVFLLRLPELRLSLKEQRRPTRSSTVEDYGRTWMGASCQLTEATVGRRREPSCACQQLPTSCPKFQETDMVEAHFTHVRQRDCRAQ